MKELSMQNVILPITIVLIAVIALALISTRSMSNIREECTELSLQLDVCTNTLNEREERLSNVVESLNITKVDLSRYDEIYNETQQTADELKQALEEEIAKDDAVIVYNVPYRSVPTYEDFNKAVKIELLLEKIDYAEKIYKKQFVHDTDLKIIVGYLYLNAVDFRNIYTNSNGAFDYPKGQDAYDAWKTSSDLLDELDLMYHDFDNYNVKKLKTRVGQIIKLQRNSFTAMQSLYFLR